MEENQLKSKSKNDEISRKKAKKRLIIIISIIFAVMLILGTAVIIIENIPSKEEEFEVDYRFYPADYGENIFEDEKYLSLIAEEFIRYTDLSTGVTVGISKDTAKEQGSEVQFLVDMVYDAINGDHNSYNARFSNTYYEKHAPKDSFTMQKIYDVLITYVSEEDTESNYTKSIYCVEYKIYENNGTFRCDIGDGSKKQYFTLNTYEDGTILIDAITTVNIAKK